MGFTLRMAKRAFLSSILSLLAVFVLACAGGGGGSSITTPWPGSDPNDVPMDYGAATSVVAQLNYYRSLGSLPPVTLDHGLSSGCQLHANYLQLNSVSLGSVGLAAHTETKGLPGYSASGAKAGANSVIYEGVTPVQAVNNWMQTLYHRLGMMDPNLKQVGFGTQGRYQVLDIGQGRTRGINATGAVSLFPWPGMQSVPGAYVREIPHPISGDDEIGIPITVEFFGGRGLAIEGVSVTLYDVTAGQELGCYVQYPGRPFLSQWDLGQLIAVIPHQPLPPRSTILVSVNAIVDFAPFSTEWQFTTR
jgi:hypothetical protein